MTPLPPQLHSKFIACLKSVVIAGAAAQGRPFAVRRQYPFWWVVADGDRVLGHVKHPRYLTAVMEHCAASGWDVAFWGTHYAVRPCPAPPLENT